MSVEAFPIGRELSVEVESKKSKSLVETLRATSEQQGIRKEEKRIYRSKCDSPLVNPEVSGRPMPSGNFIE